MRTAIGAGCVVAALTVGIIRADEPEREKRLAETGRQLEKDIAEIRGLKFKTPVKASVIARPKDAAKGIQGYYSTKDKALYVYDDVAGNYERGVLIHEMVHALQDQHFGLEKLHEAVEGDAELARAALIEGDATFTMIELLKKEQPRVAAMLDTPPEKARDLRNWLLYARGARYVKALKERGGWDNVNRAYRFPPQSTAQILFPDERASVIDLGPGKSRGAFGIVQALAAKPATAAESLQAATGYRGDREVVADRGSAWVVAFDTPENAERFRETFRRTLGGPPGTVDRHVRLERTEARVTYLDAVNAAASRELRERVEGPLRLEVYAAS